MTSIVAEEISNDVHGYTYALTFYDDNNNFKDFSGALKLLFQVMAGQNYMWLTADLVAEGKEENLLFFYFITFYIINVLILVNLFTIIVL